MPPSADDVYASQSAERMFTGATIITLVRTVLTLVVAMWAAKQGSLAPIVAGLAVYWVGDSLDGEWARWRHCETRIGAVIDMLCDRLSCAALYLGLVWLEPPGWFSDEPMTWISIPIAVYLFEFVVVDLYLSLAFLAWPISSPNYFYVVDRRIYQWNWSRVGKAANSGAFVVILLVTGWVWLGTVIALALLVLKCISLKWLLDRGIPIPERTSA